jgi:hypothetical protein
MAQLSMSTTEFLQTLGLGNHVATLDLSQSPIHSAIGVLQALNPEALELPGSAAYEESVREHW